MEKNKELTKEMYESVKSSIKKSIEDVINSCNFPLEFLIYYDDVCLRNDIIMTLEALLGIRKKYVHTRYEHMLIMALEIIIREKYKEKDINNNNPDTSIIKNNIRILDRNKDSLLDFYDIYIAKNGVFSDRYEVEISNNQYEFFHKDYNLKYNIQGFYEKKGIFQYKDTLNVDKYIGEAITKNDVRCVYEWFLDNMDILQENDTLGVYTVSDFLWVWSIIYRMAQNDYHFKYTKLMIALDEYVKKSSNDTLDIPSNIEAIYNFIKESTDAKEEFTTLIFSAEYDEFINIVADLTELNKDTIKSIVNDLIYLDSTQKYSIMQYPLIKLGNKVIMQSFYILNECNVEIIMKKKSELLYREIYVNNHKKIIEPRICLKIKKLLDKNKNFKVICSSDTLTEEGNDNKSQIDIFIFDIKKKDIMIIEVKDRIAKLDNVEVTNQVNFERKAFQNGAIKQLKNQEKLIKMQKNLNLFLPKLKVEEINNIYLGYCETFYLGTPRFIYNLVNKDIAYIPFKLLLKMNNWSSVKKMYDYFLKAKYLNQKRDYTYRICKINRFGYKIKIPVYNQK